MDDFETNKLRVEQLSRNCKWLIGQIDQIHAALCPGELGTWQDRAKQAVAAAKPLTPAAKGEKMSGGHFDFGQSRIYEIAEDIETIIRNNESKEKNEWGDDIGYHFLPEIIEKFSDAVKILKTAYVYAQRVDWLLAGDDGEESFLERLEEELAKIEKTT